MVVKFSPKAKSKWGNVTSKGKKRKKVSPSSSVNIGYTSARRNVK